MTVNQQLSDIMSQIEPLDSEFQEIIDTEAKLEKLGVPPVHTPDDSSEPPKYPSDLSGVGNTELGDTYGKFMAWSGYLRYLSNLKTADILLTKNRIHVISSMLRDSASKDNALKNSDQRKAYVESDGTILQLEMLLAKFEAEKSIVDARYYHFDNCAKALSREISRREPDRHSM